MHEIAQKTMEFAAIRIQRFFRNYLASKKNDEKIVENLKKLCQDNAKDLEKISRFCLLVVGKKAKESAVVLQRAVRRRKFLKKVMRLLTVSEAFKTEKERKIVEKLKTFLAFFGSKEKVKELKWSRNVKARLKKIRRKLAVLAIKNIVRREKINLRIMKNKIRKYRRFNSIKSVSTKQKEKHKRGSITEVLNLANATEESSLLNEENSSTNTEKLEKERAFQLEQEKKEKISLGLISYKVRKDRYKYYRKIKKNSTAIIVNSSNDSLHLKNSPIKTPIPMIIEEKIKPLNLALKVHSKTKSVSNRNRRNYLRPTVCSEYNKYVFRLEEEEKKEVLLNFKYVSKGKVLLPTLSSKVKLKSKQVFTPEPTWNINPYMKMSYTPSINNYSFVSTRSKSSITPCPRIFLPASTSSDRNI